MLSYFPRDVLDEIWDLVESVSGGFATYSLMSSKDVLRKTLTLHLLVFSGA